MSDSLRLLRRAPRFAVVAVLILAVGIGACTAMFSIVHAVLLRPMALPNAARVVMLWSIDVRHDAVIESTYETEADFRCRLRSFDDVALIGSVNWGGALLDRRPRGCPPLGCRVSGTFFQLLGSSALLGRVFDAKDDDPQAERRLVLSHAAWTQFFGADPSVMGRKVMMREEATPQAFEVIGVMPPEFFFPRGAQYWTTGGTAARGDRASHQTAACRSVRQARCVLRSRAIEAGRQRRRRPARDAVVSESRCRSVPHRPDDLPDHRHATARLRLRPGAADLVAVDGSRRPGPADRVWQCRGPGVRARSIAAARARRPCRARRKPRRPRPAAAR